LNKEKLKKYVTRAILIVLIIINCVVIFKFSSEQSEKSNQTSGRVVETIVEKSPKTKNLTQKEKEKKKEEIVTPVRKTAHFTVYMCLGALLHLLCRTFEGKNWKKVLISIALAFTYACSDELHQIFVSGRSGEFRDVCIDSCGAMVGALIVLGVATLIGIIIKNKHEKVC
jgi:VanZ family protein